MLTIGEEINGTRKKTAAAIAARDADFIRGLASRQVEAVADIPAATEREVPAGCTDLELTLNVLVYGLEGAAIERMTGETADDIARGWKRTIRPEETQHAHHHVHTSHPSCSQGGYDE